MKVYLGSAILTGGACSVVLPMSLTSTGGKPGTVSVANPPSHRGGQLIASNEEEGISKWNETDLQLLIKVIFSRLLSHEMGEGSSLEARISKVSGGQTGSGVNQNDSLWVQERVKNTQNPDHEFKTQVQQALSYILHEGVKNQGNSFGNGEYGGTSGNRSNQENVMMIGTDSPSSEKNTLMKVKWTSEPGKYIIGRYESDTDTANHSNQKGVLSLGLSACTTQSGPQCQINKSVAFQPKLKISFTGEG